MFRKPRRRVNRVFIHCSASDNPKHDNAATMDRWHKERGWNGIGYHYFIRKNGTIERGRNINRTPAAQAGHNRGTIAICCHGLKKFTRAQFRSLNRLCSEIDAAYGGEITFHGHCEVSNKTCPVFDYKHVLGLDADGYRQGGHIAMTPATQPVVSQFKNDLAGKPPIQSKTNIAIASSAGLGAVASASRAASEIAENTTSIFGLVSNPWVWVALLILGIAAYGIWRHIGKAKETGE